MTEFRAFVMVVAVLLLGCGEAPAPQTARRAEPTHGTSAERDAGPGVELASARETPAGDVVDRFVASLAPGFHAAQRAADDPYPLSPDGPLPRRIEAWSFVAGEPEPTEPGVRLRFSLRIFEFGSVDQATNALAGLAATAEDSVLLKAPLLAVQLGSNVLRLDGACNFARERWGEVQDALIRVLPPDGAASGALEILCGGSVVRTPASGSPGGGRGEYRAGHGVEE